MNLPPGFEIEEPGIMNLPTGFELEAGEQEFPLRTTFEPIEHDVAYKAYSESIRRLDGPKASVATVKEFGNMNMTGEWLDFLSENPVRFSERLRKEWSGIEAVKKIPFIGAGISAAETGILLDVSKRLGRDDYEVERTRKMEIYEESIAPFRAKGQLSIAPAKMPVIYNKLEDEKLMGDYILDAYEAELRGMTWGAKVAAGISILPTYMLEFMITGGLAKMGNTAVQKAGTKLLAKYATTKAGQATLKAAGWTGGVITRATLGFPTHTAKTAVERQLDTELGIRGEENWGTSVAMGWLNTVVQTGSESAGAAFGPAGRRIGAAGARALKKLPFGSKMLTGLQRMWRGVTGGTAMQFTNKLLERGGYHGIIAEVGEERLATFFTALFGIEHYGAGEGSSMRKRIMAGLQQDLDNIDVELAVLGAIPGAKFGIKFAGDIASIPSKRHWATIYHGSNVTSYDKTHPVDEDKMAEGFKATTKKKEAKKIGQHITALEIDKRRFIEVTDENRGEIEALVQQSGVDPGTTLEAGLEAMGYDGIKRGNDYTLFHPNTYLAEGIQIKTQAEVTPAAQQAATETIEESRTDSVDRTQQLRQEEYEVLTRFAEEGDEAAAWRIREMDKEGFEEQQLPTIEILLEKALAGDEVAKTAIEDGQYKGAREAVKQLEPETVAEEDTLRKVYSKGFIAKLTSIRNNADNIAAGVNNKAPLIKKMKSDLAEIQEHYGNIAKDIKNNPELLAELGEIERLLPEYVKAINSFIKSPSEEGSGRIKTTGIQIAEFSDKYSERLDDQEAKKKVMSFEEWKAHKDPRRFGKTNVETYSTLETQKQRYGWYIEDRGKQGIVAYHGTDKKFIKAKALSFFAKDKEVADTYQVKDKSPTDITPEDVKKTGGRTIKVRLDIQNPYKTTIFDANNIVEDASMIQKLKDQGHDGIFAYLNEQDIGKKNTYIEYVPFYESQIVQFDRGSTRVDSTIPATDEQVRNFATIKVHSLANLLGVNKKDRYKIQFDLTGIKSMEDMKLKDALTVRDYFIAEANIRNLSTSTGNELAAAVKLHTTQKQVQAAAALKPVGLKRMLKATAAMPVKWWQTSKRVERLLEQLDGFTEGPLYNSIWKVVHTATVNSRVSKNTRIIKFKEALVDIMAPELQTDEGIAEATEVIAAEETAAGKKTRKLGKRAVRKLVGDSLWSRYVTGGRTIVSEATAIDPELSMSASERIGMYMASKNKDSLRHLLAGNLVTFEKPELTLLKIIDSMSDQEKQIAEWILNDLEENFDRANQAAIIGLGHELEQQDNYFPIRVLDVDVLKKQDFLSELENKYTKKDVKPRPGETKKRVPGAKRALDLDAFGVYLNHISRIEQFINMAPVAKSVGQILNTEDFQQAVNNVTSGHGAGVLNRWLKHSVQGHAIDMEPGVVSQTFLWSRQKGVLFALARNIPSVARQFISGFNAVAMHPMTLVYTAQHLAMSVDPRYYNMLEKRMRELSPEMDVRSFERYFANLKHQAQAAGILTGRESWSVKALSWQKWADRRTVTIAWNAAYDAGVHSEAVQKQFELDGSEEAAIAYANKMIARTQPMGDVEHLPDYFTGGTVERLLSTFMNQVNNNWNFWAHDIYGMRKAGKISNKMVAYRVLFSNILPSMMFGAISRGGPPDDWEDAMFDWMAYSISPLFLVGRIITDAILGFAGGQTSVEEMLPGNLAKTIGAVVRKKPGKAALYGVKTFGGLVGRPSNQQIRTVIGIRDLVTGETDDWRRIIYSEWSLTKYGWPEDADKGRKPIQR